MKLAQQLRDIAAMAITDGCDDLVIRWMAEMANWIDIGGESGRSHTRSRLRIMKGSVRRAPLLGAETHIALACEAFEKTYGPL
jgi:hypothetical protein